MSKTIKVALAGAGAFGIKHLDGIRHIDGVEVVSLIGRRREPTEEVARQYGIAHVATDLADSLALPEVDAVILCTPTQVHAAQAAQCLQAGKHVQVEIPLCDKLADGQRVAELQRQTGLVAMCGHTRRFNPSHQYVHQKVAAGTFNIQQMDVQTYFFRRTNTNALGQARSLDRPPAVAPRGAHGRSVRVSGRQPHRAGPRRAGPDPSASWASPWT
ncbi:hypothetical protein MASR1M50_28030 [Burkholderiales bacterium]